MSDISLKILAVEDNKDHVFLILHEIKKGGYVPDISTVCSLEDVVKALDSTDWDVILCDYSLPGFTGVDVLNEYNKRNLDIPFIVVSGEIGEDTAVTLMKSGAHDYVFKGNLTPLVAVINREIKEYKNREEGRRLNKLRESEAIKFKLMIDAALDGIALIDDGRIIECNQTTCDIFKVSEDSILKTKLTDKTPEYQPDGTSSREFLDNKLEEAALGVGQEFECQLKRNDETLFFAEITLKQIILPDSKLTKMTLKDITDRKRIEKEMRDQLEMIRELQQQEMTMIDQNPLPLLLMDLNLHILKVNESFLQLSGYNKDTLMNMTAHEFEILEKRGDGLKKALLTKKATTGEFTIKFPSGIHYVEQDIIPLLDKADNVTSVMSTYKDKTEEIRKEKEIQKMIGEAKEQTLVLNDSAEILGVVLGKVASGDLTVKVDTNAEDPLVTVKENANNTIGALHSTIVTVSHVSGEVSVSMKDISEGSSDITKTFQKISETSRITTENGRNLITHMEDITNQISNLSASNEEVTDTSQEVLKHAREVTVQGARAQKLGNETNERMMLVTKIAQESVDDISELNTQIKEINKIIKLINDIAAQINLLSLNAAIEAARAGDAGRGFAVVAGEVKNLAADARSATDHIAEVITAIQHSSEKTSNAIQSSHNEIANGVESVANTIEALNMMVTGASEVTHDMDDIVKAVEEQTRIAATIVNTAHDGINLTIDNLKQAEQLYAMSEEVSASVEEINSAIMEVENLSSEMKDNINKFRL